MINDNIRNMGDGTGNISHYLKKMFKPSIGKMILFTILVFLLMFLPLYPVHVDTYFGSEEDNINELEFSGTRMKSLYMVIDEDYNWTEMDLTFRVESLFYRFPEYHISYCNANPYYLPIYGILIFVAYYASCLYIESSKKD